MYDQSRLSVGLAGLLAGLVCACAERPTITVTGPITDLGNGEPLADARVCLTDSELCTETNESGRFEFIGVAAEKPHSLSVDLHGYLAGLIPFTARAIDKELAVISLGGDIIIDLQMAVLNTEVEPGRGQVVFSISNGIFGDRINVPGISVTLSPGGGSPPHYLSSGGLPDLDLSQTSDNGGGLIVNLPPGLHTLSHQNLPAGCTTILGWSGPESLRIPVQADRVTYARIECSEPNSD